VPQYVYVFAHNERDAVAATGHVDRSSGTSAEDFGGNEAASTATTVKHYVETEDTPDNMLRRGFVQQNLHGGVYTWGNLERCARLRQSPRWADFSLL
jgi:hypothetical protein